MQRAFVLALLVVVSVACCEAAPVQMGSARFRQFRQSLQALAEPKVKQNQELNIAAGTACTCTAGPHCSDTQVQVPKAQWTSRSDTCGADKICCVTPVGPSMMLRRACPAGDHKACCPFLKKMSYVKLAGNTPLATCAHAEAPSKGNDCNRHFSRYLDRQQGPCFCNKGGDRAEHSELQAFAHGLAAKHTTMTIANRAAPCVTCYESLLKKMVANPTVTKLTIEYSEIFRGDPSMPYFVADQAWCA